MTRDHTSILRAATHVALDTATAERLTKLGAANVVRAYECLVIGPSRLDVREHVRLRAAWWGPSGEWDRLYSPDVRWELPVAVWVSASPVERVNLWRTCSRLRDLRISHRDVLILELPPAPRRAPRREPFDCADSVADHPDTVLLSHIESARSWTRARFDRAVGLWEEYVDADLSRFARTCARGLAGHPQLGAVWALLTSFLPRATEKGKLRLSRLDGLLLGILSDVEWRTALKVYADKSAKGEAVRELGSCTGDLFVVSRLNDWASHGPHPAVERAPGPRPDVEMNAFVYRLTEHGMRLRKRGLAQLSDAPKLPIAGFEAYASGSPWVLRTDGTVARHQHQEEE